MATKIEWTEKTWNPVTGCTKISPGCTHCYAERMAKRLVGRYGYPADEPFRVTLHPDRLDQPLRWRKPRRVFVCSMGDLFHGVIPGRFVERVLDMTLRPHVYQILTKRPERMREWFLLRPPRDNLWLGVTAENQQCADERIPLLLQTPATVRFVSVEPMLEPVRIFGHFSPTYGHPHPFTDLHWVIIGCESGPGRRPMELDWARDLVQQCKAAGVSVFVKQLPVPRLVAGVWRNVVSHDPAEWPEDLRVREYPA